MTRRGPGGNDDELLAAYLDGVAELTPEERQRVEATLPALDAEATRAMRATIDQLRALPPEGNEPDWRALERRIAAGVDTAGPPWWRRWLVVVPVGALAVAAAALLWLHRTAEPAREPAPERVVVATPDAAPSVAPEVRPPVPPESTEVWVAGAILDVTDVDPDLLDVPDELPTGAAADDYAEALLPAGDLTWVDELDDPAIERAEHWLERKKS